MHIQIPTSAYVYEYVHTCTVCMYMHMYVFVHMSSYKKRISKSLCVRIYMVYIHVPLKMSIHTMCIYIYTCMHICMYMCGLPRCLLQMPRASGSFGFSRHWRPSPAGSGRGPAAWTCASASQQVGLQHASYTGFSGIIIIYVYIISCIYIYIYTYAYIHK